MKHEFTADDSGATLMTVEDDDYGDGRPALTIETPSVDGQTGATLDAADVRRLHGITAAWLREHTGAIV